MTRSVLVIFCVCCVATVLSEALGLTFLWYRGQLTAETLKDLRLVLTGQNQDPIDVEDENEKKQPSLDEITRDRSLRILELSTREGELALLKTLIDEKADHLITEQAAFEKKRKEFEDQLQQLNASITLEATEQSRGILLALPPVDAAENLMQLSLEDNVILLKGMPEKSIARILQEFIKGEAAQQQRGREIFEAITRGDPSVKLVEETFGKLD